MIRHELPPKEETNNICPEVIEIQNAMGREYCDKLLEMYSRPDILFHPGE